jgi:hypothetical protein
VREGGREGEGGRERERERKRTGQVDDRVAYHVTLSMYASYTVCILYGMQRPLEVPCVYLCKHIMPYA